MNGDLTLLVASNGAAQRDLIIVHRKIQIKSIVVPTYNTYSALRKTAQKTANNTVKNIVVKSNNIKAWMFPR